MPESPVDDQDDGRSGVCEGFYRSLLAAMRDGFTLNELICDPPGQPYDFRILDVNPGFERMFNLKKEMLIGRTYRQVAAKADVTLIERFGRVALHGGEAEFELYSQKVERHFQLLVYRPAPLQFAVILKEITAGERVAEDLWISEAKSRALLDSIPDLIFHISEDGTILDCRAPVGGCIAKPESFIGGRLEELLPPDLAQKVFARMVVAHKSSSVTSFEFRAPLGGIDCDYEARMVYGKEGSFILLLRDISEKKRIEQALIESEHRFRGAVDSIPYYFVIYDQKLRFRYANRMALEIIGLPEERIYGHTNEELFRPEIVKAYADHLRRALETRSIQRVEYAHDLKSGRLTFFSTYVPILSEKGDVSELLGISFDITRTRETEGRLMCALEENRKQNRVLQNVVEEMRRNYDEVERLLYTITHDLMTPLITIQGFLGLLKKDVEKCNRIRIEIDLGLINDAVSRMRTHLVSALELSSLGILSGSMERLAFKDIVGKAQEHFKNRCGSTEGLIITADDDFPPLYASRTRMVDVLISMIDGCIRYSGSQSGSGQGEGGEGVHVGWRDDASGPVYFVRCREGGDQLDAGQAFDLCIGQEAEDSTTIGLAISKRIIELQGGRMWMESDRKNGCSILFTIPEMARARSKSRDSVS